MKVGDVVRCTSKETNESKIGVVAEIYSNRFYRVCFGDPKWDEGYWTGEAMEKVCGK